jgi:hypothetical protein
VPNYENASSWHVLPLRAEVILESQSAFLKGVTSLLVAVARQQRVSIQVLKAKNLE